MLRPLLLPLLALPMLSMAQETWVVKPVDLFPMAKDFAPFSMDSVVLIASLRDRGELVTYRDSRTGEPLSDVYQFTWDGQKAGTPKPMDGGINTKLNDGPVSLTADGRLMCITRNQGNVDKPAKAGQLGLFFHRRTAEGWSDPEPFAYNNSAYATAHGALSPDGRRLVFASNAPGGAGGMDLYLCEREGDGWSAPIPLGTVNGPGNELYPSMDHRGTLYFASDRPGGEGGLDILIAPVRGSKWAEAHPLPAPMNSPGHEMGISFNRDGRSGFLASSRDGGERIYAFEHMLTPFANCQEETPDNLCFRLVVPEKNVLPNKPVHFRWNLGDGTTSTERIVEHCYSEPGRYRVSLDLVDEQSGELFMRGEPYTVVAEPSGRPRMLLNEHPYAGRSMQLRARDPGILGFQPHTYLWDVGNERTLRGQEVDHAFPQVGSVEVRLDVQGIHTASGRTVSHCVKRSIQVLRKGEMPEVKEGKAFVFRELPSDLFMLNLLEGEDGDFHIELFASQSRVGLDDPMFMEVRKLYRVMERYDTVRGVYSYTVGPSGSLDEAYEVYRKIRELQFMTPEILRMRDEKVADLSSLDLFSAEELAHAVIRSSTVRFATGAWQLEKKYREPLAKVVRLLERNPGMGISVEAHTDNVGSDALNFELSQKRAQSLVDHFVSVGIALERLVPVGHGENHPIADNASEQGRANNRRVEFRLMELQDRQASQHRE